MLISNVVVWLMQAISLSLERSTFQRLILLSMIPGFLAVVGLAWLARDVPVTETRGRPRFSWRNLPANFRRYVLVVVLFTLGNSADAFLVLRAQERGLSVLGVLGMLATFNLVYTVVSGPAGALSDKIGRRKLLVGGWLVYALLYLGFGVAAAAWQVWLLYALYGIYYGTVEGTAKAFVADLVGPEQRGTAYGVYNAAVGFSALPASLIAGVLWQGVGNWGGFGAAAPFLFGAVLAIAAAVLLHYAMQTHP